MNGFFVNGFIRPVQSFQGFIRIWIGLATQNRLNRFGNNSDIFS
jgi:hypothetical protein